MQWFKLVFLLCFVYGGIGCDGKRVYRIGGLFNDENQTMVFKTAVDIMNKKYEFSQMQFLADPVIIPIHNTLLAYNSACKLFEKGIIGLFGPSSIHSSSYIQSLCDRKEIPHIEHHQDLNTKRERDNTLANIYPHSKTLSYLLFDLIEVYGWRSFVILYDNDENLLSVTSMFDFNSQGRTVVLRQLELEEGNEISGYRPVLTKIKKTGEKQFLIVCSITILESVLKHLQEVGMMTDIYSYIIANLDMQTVDLQPYKYAGTNITGIRMVNLEDNEVINIAESIQEGQHDRDPIMKAWQLKFESALIVDAVHLFFETIYSLTEDGKKSINAKSIYCKTDHNWADGTTIINLMKTQKSVKGLTGPVKFDNEGFRKDFIVDILELAPGNLLKIGDWNSTSRSLRFRRPDKPQDETIPSLFNRTFAVVINISPPYVMLKEDTSQLVGNDRYEGYCIDIIEKLAATLGFNYTFVRQEDDVIGKFDKTTKTWDGMMRQIIDGKADLGITDFTITSERESAVDFTMPFMNLGISILYRKPEPVPPSLFMFASPFSLLVWVMLGISYFVVSLALFIMGRLSPSEWQNPYPCVEEPEYLVNQFTIRNSLWFTIGALMQQGTELAPIAISTRTISGVWWFFVLIMVSSYTANLAAFLTVETLVTPFKNINELANQTVIKYGAKKNGATANYFRDSNLSSYQRIWTYMVKHPENMVVNNDEGVDRVEKENYAFLMESTTIEYATERHCNLAQVGGFLDDKGYGIAMAKEAPYRNDLSSEILKLQENGVLMNLKIKWWKEKRGGGRCASKSEGGEATPLDLQNVGGVFLVLFIGSLLGFIGSFVELIIHVYKKSKTMKLSFREEFKREMRFFVAFKQNVKEVAETNSEDANENNLIEKNENGY